VLPPLPRDRSCIEELHDSTPIPWICERLELRPGRPNLLIGYPGAGKTLIGLSMALSLAVGRPIWNAVDFRPSRPCRVLWVDLDFGGEQIKERLRDLRKGLGITDEELAQARALAAELRPRPVGTSAPAPARSALEIETIE